jgi:hypothetical protein
MWSLLLGRKKRRFQQEPSREDMPWWEQFWRWTGWRGKKLWDWQALLFIPVTIALIASLFALYQSSRQQEIENLRAERAALETYIEDVGTLLLEKDLRTADEDDDVRLLARARTLAVLDGVSGARKVRVLEFLYETKLIQSSSQGKLPVISLKFADLRETRLVKRSILSGTDLDRAELSNAKLDNAKLINAKLPRADLTDADLTDADLTAADLSGADLPGADLSGADLSNAKGVSCWQTQSAESLDNATMPNGLKYADWLKEKDGCKSSRKRPFFRIL